MSEYKITTIYLIEERFGPSKDGPWGEWTAKGKPPGSIFPRPILSERELTKIECQSQLIGTTYKEGIPVSSFRELRCIPFDRRADAAEEAKLSYRDEALALLQKVAYSSVSPNSAILTDYHIRMVEVELFETFLKGFQLCLARGSQQEGPETVDERRRGPVTDVADLVLADTTGEGAQMALWPDEKEQ